jgi:phosphoglycerate kinase
MGRSFHGESRVRVRCGGAGLVRQPSGLPSIADILLRCREPPQWANCGPLQCSKRHGMANTFLAAQGKKVGRSLCEHELAGTARDILSKAKAKNCEIVLPVDAVAARKFEANAPSRVVSIDDVGSDEMILDIGPRTIEHVVSVLARVKTLVWNGPFGAFEMKPFDNGTVEVAEAAAELTAAGKLVSVAGGGDTVAALNASGATERLTYVSTAGGAFLEWLEGKALPGIEVFNKMLEGGCYEPR